MLFSVKTLFKWWHHYFSAIEIKLFCYIEGILPRGPYLLCISMAGRALLAGYPRYAHRAPQDINRAQGPGPIFTRGQFWPSGIVVAPVRPSVRHQVCPRDNSSPVQARITKFAPKMQNTLVKVPVVLGGNQPWPSRSNLRSKSKFTPFWVCPHHNSSPIQARITKFGPEVHNTLVKIPIVLGGNWPWPSRSNLT